MAGTGKYLIITMKQNALFFSATINSNSMMTTLKIKNKG